VVEIIFQPKKLTNSSTSPTKAYWMFLAHFVASFRMFGFMGLVGAQAIDIIKYLSRFVIDVHWGSPHKPTAEI